MENHEARVQCAKQWKEFMKMLSEIKPRTNLFSFLYSNGFLLVSRIIVILVEASLNFFVIHLSKLKPKRNWFKYISPIIA